MKQGGQGIPDPRLLVERAYNTSKAASEVLIGSLLGGSDLNYVVYIINPATMGYIRLVIPLVKVNRAEEGIGNTKYILLWF